MTKYRVTVSSGAGTEQDALIALGDEPTGAQLRALLTQSGFHGEEHFCDGDPIVDGAPLVNLLAHGSRITRSKEPPLPKIRVGMKVVVVAGPEAGLFADLVPGTALIVGRTEGDLRLRSDSLLSSRHLKIDLYADVVTLTDLDSANGTLIEGVHITGPTECASGSYIHAGSSVFSVIDIRHGDFAQIGDQCGATIAFPRSFRGALEPMPASVRFPGPQSEPLDDMNNSWWRAFVPVVSGIGFALMSGNYWFLLLSLFAPLVYAGDSISQRKKRASKTFLQEQRFLAATELAKTELARVRCTERARSRHDRPFGGTATVFAECLHRRLWERRTTDRDFLAITIGLSSRASAVRIDSRTDDNDDPDETREIWGMPVDAELGRTGSVAVIGEISRARAVVRGMIVNLAVTHSPSDVRIWIFGQSETRNDWDFARWLPHVMSGESAARIAVSVSGRASLWAALRQQFDQRLQIQNDGTMPTPVHVVIVDGADLVDTNDLSGMLDRGPSLGIIGIVVDSRAAPEGVTGTLRLGDSADEAVFESISQPLITDVLTAEMGQQPAIDAARRMARVSPAISGARSLAVASSRLVTMLGEVADVSQAMFDMWRLNGPQTRIAVGMAAESTFEIDLVRNGPHGLVGGASRSGKTEFLKTFIMGLAAANHPDDLNFVIIDFKGGVDYTLAAALPHVLEVSSNQDLDRFERTAAMLMAEQQRRQSLFERNDVANLDAYRIARIGRPSLPPVPRLVVLVDEFGELRSTESGQAQLKKLESITRIGAALGINLMLITQNFSGQLPDQIAANTGLRICFRVEENEHSRVLLGSGIASTLDPAIKGRGFARLQGSEPIEFQTARIAGRRVDGAVSQSFGAMYLRPLETLYRAIVEPEPADVPAPESDMFTLIETVRRAAALGGWTENAIPWPERLLDDAPLDAAYIDGVQPDAIQVGVVDLPNEQRRGGHSLRFDDDHVLFIGGPRADLQHALTMTAVSAALQYSPDELHMYGIDLAGRGLARIAGLPNCGAVASRSDRLALRILEYLREEVARRRALLAESGVTSLADLKRRRGLHLPHVLLLVASAERMLPNSNSGTSPAVFDAVSALVDDASGLGIQVVLAGLPSVATFRPGALIERRLVFRTVDPLDAVGVGASRSLIGELDCSRKFVDVNNNAVGLFCSLACGETDETEALEAFIYRMQQRCETASLVTPPRAFGEGVWPLPINSFLERLQIPNVSGEIPFAIGADAVTGEALWNDVRDVGPIFSISGQSKSGRSSALLAASLVAKRLGWSVIGTGFSKNSPLLRASAHMTIVSAAQLDAALAIARGNVLVLVDDLHRMRETLPDFDHWHNATLTIVAGTADSVCDTRGPLKALGLTTSTNGLVLSPNASADFEPLDVRRDAIRQEFLLVQRKGVGVMGIDGELFEIIVPFMTQGTES